MRYLLLIALLLPACGQVVASGTIVVKHEVAIDQLMDDFRALCVAEKAPDIDACEAAYVDRLMSLVGKK